MKKRLLFAFFLIAYCAILIKVMVFKDLPVIRIGPLMLNFGGTHEGPANLIPFKTILPYLLGEKGLIIAGINIFGNIILLVPVGFLVPFIFRNITWKKSLAIAVGAGLAIEGMQEVFRVGIFDIDDVILNGLGVMIGYWMFKILAKWVREGKLKTIIITAIIMIAAAVVVLYAIYPKGQPRMNSRIDTGRLNVDTIDNVNSDSLVKINTEINQGKDPCGGTAGTGQIVGVGNNSITIKLNNGTDQIIKLTEKTTIKNSVGSLSQSDLKPGIRVTVVIDDSETAAVVLVCNDASAEPVK